MCFFTACIVNAYEALHTNGYVYRDMKPANVLIKENGYAVLIDFGLAAKLNTALKGKCGTRGYWPPEMVKVCARARAGTQHETSLPNMTPHAQHDASLHNMTPPCPT